MKNLSTWIFIFLLTASCQTEESTKRSDAAPESSASADAQKAGGSVPAHYNLQYATHDRSGEKIVLLISTTENRFTLSRQAGQEDPVITTGSLNTERGYNEDRDATVYVLNDDKPGQEIYFLRRTGNGTELIHLDATREATGVTLFLEETHQ